MTVRRHIPDLEGESAVKSSPVTGRTKRKQLPANVTPGVLALVTSCALVASGCVVDGGPSFAARALIVNHCLAPIEAKTSTDIRGSSSNPDGELVIESGGTLLSEVGFIAPVPEVVYLWTALPSADTFGEPLALDTDSLEVVTDADGYEVYTVRVSGPLCPSA